MGGTLGTGRRWMSGSWLDLSFLFSQLYAFCLLIMAAMNGSLLSRADHVLKASLAVNH